MTDNSSRSFRLYMEPIIFEAKDHFDACTKFFNVQEGIGLMWVQEMKGAETVNQPLNIRTIFNQKDGADEAKLKRIASLHDDYKQNKISTGELIVGIEVVLVNG